MCVCEKLHKMKKNIKEHPSTQTQISFQESRVNYANSVKSCFLLQFAAAGFNNIIYLLCLLVIAALFMDIFILTWPI